MGKEVRILVAFHEEVSIMCVDQKHESTGIIVR